MTMTTMEHYDDVETASYQLMKKQVTHLLSIRSISNVPTELVESIKQNTVAIAKQFTL
jgi:hypothetical protein